jgi:hypothetical protein
MMRGDREALEDAFDRAEGAQEIAFRNYRRALARNYAGLMRAALEHGARTQRELARIAAQLSTVGRNAR